MKIFPPLTHISYLCVKEGQTPDSVEGDQHFDQKLFMLRFQRQSETIDYTGEERDKNKESKYELNMNTWKSFIVTP